MAVPDPPSNESLFARLAGPPAAPPLNSRRFYMRPVFRYAVAASLLAALLGGLLSVGVTAPALADVVKAAEKYKLVKYKIRQITDDKRNGIGERESIAYADLRAPRFRTESGVITLNGTVKSSFYSVQDDRAGVTLSVLTETVIEGKADDPDLPESDRAILTDGRFPRKEASLSRANPGFNAVTNSPAKTILENLRALEKHEGVTAVKEKRDGKDLLRYRLEDGTATTILWVDETTKLPVRLEYEVIDPTPDIARNRWIHSDFEWDPKLEGVKDAEDLFRTTPPEGYKVTDLTKS
jgi:hypothetical protein